MSPLSSTPPTTSSHDQNLEQLSGPVATPIGGTWMRERILGFSLAIAVYALYYPFTQYALSLTPVDVSHWVDHALPLSPWWIIIYAMIYPAAMTPICIVRDPIVLRRVICAYLLLEVITLTLFIMVPVHMTIRPGIESISADSFVEWGLKLCYWIDHPTCCFPSLHVATAMLAGLTCRRVHPVAGIIMISIAIAISLSTLLVKQHFIADVILGATLAFIADHLAHRGSAPVSSERLSYPLKVLLIPLVMFSLILTVFILLYARGWTPWLG